MKPTAKISVPLCEHSHDEMHLVPSKPASSLLVSLADKVDNAEAILNDYRNIGENLWTRFTGGRVGTIWYYRKISEIFNEALPSALARQLAEVVSRLPG